MIDCLLFQVDGKAKKIPPRPSSLWRTAGTGELQLLWGQTPGLLYFRIRI